MTGLTFYRCHKCGGETYTGVPHECPGYTATTTGLPTTFTKPLCVGDRPTIDGILRDIESIKEDIEVIMDRLERLEL
jgi:hypothetical protein